MRKNFQNTKKELKLPEIRAFKRKPPEPEDIQWAVEEIEARKKGEVSPSRLKLQKKLASLE